MTTRRSPGVVRDAIARAFERTKSEMTVSEVCDAVSDDLGEPVAASSVRSYLNLNTPDRFTRTGRGRYKVSGRQ